MIQHCETTKSWYLGLNNVHKELYLFGLIWLPLTDEIRYSERWDEHTLHRCELTDVLDNYCQYLPGVMEQCDYGDYLIKFNMGDVTDSGWTQNDLEKTLQGISDHIINGGLLQISSKPYQRSYTDNWGHERWSWIYPHLVQPQSDHTLHCKFIDKEHPVCLSV